MNTKTIMITALLTTFGIGVGGASAAVQEMPAPAAPSVCAAPAPLPPELAAWPQRSAIKAAAGIEGLATAQLVPSQAVDAVLLRTGDVRYPVRPGKPGGSVSYGGLLGFNAVVPGTYRVALEAGAWIDILADGKPIVSGAHGHGPACSSVHKIVDFTLAAGPHVLQIAGNVKPSIGVLVVRLP